jgi:hypothetical protein
MSRVLALSGRHMLQASEKEAEDEANGMVTGATEDEIRSGGKSLPG